MRGKQVVLQLIAAILVLGVGAPAVTRADCAIVGNLVTNCNFAGDITGWTQLLGTFSHEPTDGSSSAGSMHGVAANQGGNFWLDFRQCITNPVDNTLYNFGLDIRSTFGTLNGCRIGARAFSGNACGGAGSLVQQSTLNAVTGTWTQTSGGTGQILTLTGGSVELIVACGKATETSTYTVRFDDIFFGVGLVPVELQTFEVE